MIDADIPTIISNLCTLYPLLFVLRGCFFLVSLQLSCVDLLTEAKYAERMRDCPEHAPELMSFVYGGLTIGSLFATATVHWIPPTPCPAALILS